MKNRSHFSIRALDKLTGTNLDEKDFDFSLYGIDNDDKIHELGDDKVRIMILVFKERLSKAKNNEEKQNIEKEFIQHFGIPLKKV